MIGPLRNQVKPLTNRCFASLAPMPTLSDVVGLLESWYPPDTAAGSPVRSSVAM